MDAFYITGWVHMTSSGNVMAAALVTITFAGGAWLLKGVTRSGALAGAAVSFLIYLSTGVAGFAALVSVFAVASITTRLGYSRKQELGAAESKLGRRGSQVLANVGVAAIACVLFSVLGKGAFLLAAAASLAEAAADTASSEIGEAATREARLITTMQRVPAGTDGGITLLGTLAGAIGCTVVAGCCVLMRFVPGSAFFLVSCAGFLGMLLDSVLGATLERHQLLSNDAVNFLCTLFSACIPLVIHQNSL